jgi:hypothetical protein
VNTYNNYNNNYVNNIPSSNVNVNVNVNPIIKPTRASSARPTNSRIMPNNINNKLINNLPNSNSNKVLIQQNSNLRIVSNNNNNIIPNNKNIPSQYEYKTPYKSNNQQVISVLRPTSASSRDRIQSSSAPGKTPLISQNNNKRIFNNDNNMNVLVNPIKLIDNPSKRLIPSSNPLPARNNANGNINSNMNNQNIFLKGARPNSGIASHGMVKINLRK